MKRNNHCGSIDITVISDPEKVELERRATLDKFSPQEAFMAALATSSNTEDMEAAIAQRIEREVQELKERKQSIDFRKENTVYECK